jgi:hypothetical protein
MANQAPEGEPSELIAPRLAYWLVLLGAPTLLLNMAVIPALLGSRSGIELWVDRVLALGSISSQLLALLITLLLVRLIISSLGAAAVGALERLFVFPIGAAVGFFVVAASSAALESDQHLLLAAISGFGLLICSRAALRHASTRAGGILLLNVAIASLCFAAARIVALDASSSALSRQYHWARVLSTVGQCFKLLSVMWTMTWVIVTSNRRMLAPMAAAATFTLALAVWASRGNSVDGHFIPVLLARMFAAFIREPIPLGPIQLGPAIDVFGVLMSLPLLANASSRHAVPRRAMGLLLLGQCALDVPILAGIATAGGLLLAWFSPHQQDAGAATQSHAAAGTEALDTRHDATATSDP